MHKIFARPTSIESLMCEYIANQTPIIATHNKATSKADNNIIDKLTFLQRHSNPTSYNPDGKVNKRLITQSIWVIGLPLLPIMWSGNKIVSSLSLSTFDLLPLV